ncbi:hypothetical protein, partial [Peribacillus sp. CSMR9]|uniref:hypothetical protein n=1 Tax=Peribacillus sp. CSMR9 TaxID=2981350 RepID=UPI002953C94A
IGLSNSSGIEIVRGGRLPPLFLTYFLGLTGVPSIKELLSIISCGVVGLLLLSLSQEVDDED